MGRSVRVAANLGTERQSLLLGRRYLPWAWRVEEGRVALRWAAREGLQGAWQRGQGTSVPTGEAVLAVEHDVGTQETPRRSPTQGHYRGLITATEATFVWAGALA